MCTYRRLTEHARSHESAHSRTRQRLHVVPISQSNFLLTYFCRFVAGLESRIFRLSTRFKSHVQVPATRSYRRGFCWSAIPPYEVACVGWSISHLYIVLSTILRLGQIE